MTDLTQVIPNFPTKHFTHIIPSIEKHLITTTDLLTLEPIDIARRAHVPVLEARRLVSHAVALLQGQLGLAVESPKTTDQSKVAAVPSAHEASTRDARDRSTLGAPQFISTLDPALDAALGGGFPTGHLVEIAGDRYVASILEHCLLP